MAHVPREPRGRGADGRVLRGQGLLLEERQRPRAGQALPGVRPILRVGTRVARRGVDRIRVGPGDRIMTGRRWQDVGWRGKLERLARIGVLPTDSREEALRKETLVLSAAVITFLAVVWVGTYWALGLYLSAAIPFAYQIVSVVNLSLFAKTKRYRFFRTCELALSLILPFALQFTLGGFVASSGVVLWSFTAPLGACCSPAAGPPLDGSGHSWSSSRS